MMQHICCRKHGMMTVISVRDALMMIVVINVIGKYVYLVTVNAIIDNGRRERRHETVAVMHKRRRYAAFAVS